MIHDYGPGHVFASIHVEVDAKEDVIKSHNLIDRIERDARKQLYIQLTIHMDPLLITKESMALYDKIHSVVKAYDEKLSLMIYELCKAMINYISYLIWLYLTTIVNGWM